jgi:hypothetical protein
MQQLTISGDIDGDRILGPRVHHANQLLERAIGHTALAPTAEWDLTRDSAGRRSVILVLSDSTGARVEARFDSEELAQEGRLQGKLQRIWGDLLQDRSHKLLNQLSSKEPAG